MGKKYFKRKKNSGILPLLLFFGFLLLGFFSFRLFEQKMLPPLTELSHMQSKAIANEILDASVQKALEDTQLSAENLLLRNNPEDQNSYTANTTLVNEFCVLLSRSASHSLSELPKEIIKIPLGAASNMAYFADKGPEITFTLLPKGSVDVDYETAFEAVGINQINYKIWLNISIEMKIVNPFYEESISMERKIMLADVIFGGEVPQHYFQVGQREEYLLTE